MSKKYTKDSFSESLDRRLSGFQADPWLAQRVMASEEGEVKPMKKMSFAAVLAIVLVCVLATGALAAAMNIFGIGDFFTRYAQETGTTLSENIGESIRKDATSVETDLAVFTVNETYYDECYVRLTMTIQPKDGALLLDTIFGGEGMNEEDLWSTYSQFEAETTTIGEYAMKNHGGRVAGIEPYLNACADEEPEWDGEPNQGREFVLNEDGSATVLYQWAIGEYLEQKPEREALLKIEYATARPLSEDEDYISFNEPETVQIPLKLYFTGNEKFVCDEGIDFPEAGVKVTKLVMMVTPLDINCELDYEITDAERFASAQQERSMLMFQFAYPDSEEPDGFKLYPTGYNSSFVIHTSDDPGYHHGVFSVSCNVLGDHYFLKAYTRENESYGTVEFTVKPME